MHGRSARLRLKHASIVDSSVFLGPTEVPAQASLDVTWRATGPVRLLHPSSTDPADPRNLEAKLRTAVATGTFSASENGFSFKRAQATSAPLFAEMGTERNGSYVRPHDTLAER